MKKLSDEGVEKAVQVATVFLFDNISKPSDSGCVAELDDEFNFLPSVFEKQNLLLYKLINKVNAWKNQCSLNTVMLHGDYQLGSIIYSDDLSEITGLIDWDRFSEDGYPLQDTIHLIVSTYANRLDRPRADILADLIFDKNPNTKPCALIKSVAKEMGINNEDLSMLALQVWLRYLVYAYSENMTFSKKWLNNFFSPIQTNYEVVYGKVR